MNSSNKHYTITEIVSAVYCEQKMILDRTHGAIELDAVRVKREAGIAQHKNFEDAGRRGRDSRCFIATAVYGPDATETNFLRAWRDRALMPTRTGRLLVRAYYRFSPLLLPVLPRHAWLKRLTKAFLDRVAAFLGGR